MSFMKAFTTIGSLTLISRIAGFFRDMLMAVLVGAGPITDAFFVALKLPNLFRRVTAEGAFNVAFIPVYSKELTQNGQESAADLARNIMSFMFVILTPLTMLLIVLMPFVVMVIAPGFAHEGPRYELAVHLAQITFPYLLLMSLTALLGGVMNAHERFAPFAAAPILFNFCLIVALGLHFLTQSHAGYLLAMAVFLSGIFQLIWLYYNARKVGFSYRFSLPKLDDKARRVGRLMIPGILSAGVMQINLLVDMMIASFLPSGSISYLYYADRLQQLPLGIIGVAMGAALLPILSKSIANQDDKGSSVIFNQAVVFSLILCVPAAVAFIILADVIVISLFQYGAFSVDDAQSTAMILLLYALGLPFYISSKIFLNVFFAHQDTKTPFYVSLFSAAFNIMASIGCVIIIPDEGLKVAGIAAATSATGILQFILLKIFSRRFSCSVLTKNSLSKILKVLTSAVLMGCFIYGLSAWINLSFLQGDGQNFSHISLWERVSLLMLLCVSGGGFYFALIFIWKVITYQEIRLYFSKKRQ
jgi:putative peptidoglycan lipid II flippase